jgi:hypothetical protein
MAYRILKSNGQLLATIPDGTINTSNSSLGLPGRNYAGYGQTLDTNFVHITENFAKATPPANPLQGQLWYNTNANLLYVCPADGTTNAADWVPIAVAGGNTTTTFGTVNVNGNLNANNVIAVNSVQAANGAFTNISVTANANIATSSTITANIGTLTTQAITTGANTTTGTMNGTWTITGGLSGNSLVVANGNVYTTGIRTDGYYYSNGAPFNGTYTNGNVFDYLTGANSTPRFTGNIAPSLIAATGNINTTGNISATGNITGNYIIGNGSLLTGVAVSGGTTIVNGNSNVNIPAANGNVTISSAGNANIVVVTGTGANIAGTLSSTGNANVGGTLNVTGNTTFSGTTQRIFGDFSNATFASRTAFQDKTTNNLTFPIIIPNGTNVNSGIAAFNSSDPGNSAYGSISIDNAQFQVGTTKAGTGTYVPMTFSVGGAEAARIDTTGRFLVGTSVTNWGGSPTGIATFAPTSSLVSGITTGCWNATGTAVSFYSGTNSPFYFAGSITLSTFTTAYNTSSDYRLKDNIQPLTGSGSFIDALQPRKWSWVQSGGNGVGFVAHEVAAVSPSSVSGEKDAVKEDGSPDYQVMEYGSAEFIANMIAELQELRRRVAQLEANNP